MLTSRGEIKYHSYGCYSYGCEELIESVKIIGVMSSAYHNLDPQ